MQVNKRSYNPEVWGGIECTINRVQNEFNDQLEHSGHYYRNGDLEQVAGLGISKIRYPILWEKHQPVRDLPIDWTWAEQRLTILKNHNIQVIAGLVHHGSGPSYTNLLDQEFPYLLAEYASKVAAKFPWINYYTPVNEPLTTARFSGLYGIWYPHLRDDKSFLQMLINQVKGTVLSMQQIRKINPAAQLVQTEDLGKTYSTHKLHYQADFENERRWLSYDLLCGRVTPKHPLWNYMISNGVDEQDLQFLHSNPCTPDMFGFNYYVTSERFLDHRLHLYPNHAAGGNRYQRYVDVEAVRVPIKEKTGIEVLLNEAWSRYRRPIAITEVHLHCHREDQLRWFRYIWSSCVAMKEKGIDIRGVTAWALFGSFGWDKLLTEKGGKYEPGVFDLRGGYLRETALAHYIKNINDQKLHHLLANGDGWWKRDNRYLIAQSIKDKIVVCNPPAELPILVIGKSGTLGKAFARVCDNRFIHYKLLGRTDCNISDPSSIEHAIQKYKPWAIINAAGYVRVDDAEKEFDSCFRDNTRGPEQLAIMTQQYGIKLITFSSDLVFDGNKRTPYVESDAVNPLNVYGRTKGQAERLVININPSSLVIRTSAFFSAWDEYNFVYYVRRSLLHSESITVAKDAYISPTYVPDLVNATLDLLIDDEKGIWHLANANGEVSWADFAYEIADRFGLDRQYILPVDSSELNLPARRPLYTVLSSERGIHLPTLENALRRYAAEQVMFEDQSVNNVA
ncbi:MAG: family 1 glycosylhydrolase [Candidatus Dadabacteria bacterium]